LSFCVLFFSWFYMLILINYIFVYHLFVIIHGRDNDMITSIYKFIKSWWPLRLWLWYDCESRPYLGLLDTTSECVHS
jgi:hypothetical protein